MTEFEERTIDISGGIKMRYRRYPGGDMTPVICIHGLTRNASDFEDVAPLISARTQDRGRDVYVVSLRGRGTSDRDPNVHNYHPFVYRDDILALLDKEGIDAAIFVGTSLGGIVSMLVNEKAGDRVAGVVLNDIGPDLAPEGLARIAGYVGGSGSVDSIENAALAIRAINAVAFPDATDEDWLKFARRTFRQREDGAWELDYDPGIARPFNEGDHTPDLWAAFMSLTAKPTLLINGELSDLLTPAIVDKMRAAHPALLYCPVARVGHAPMLTEPESVRAIHSFLAAF